MLTKPYIYIVKNLLVDKRAYYRCIKSLKMTKGKNSTFLMFSALCLCSVSWATTFTVSNGADDGVGSLRQAINDAQTSGGRDTISIDAAVDTIILTTYSDAFGISHLTWDDTLIIFGNNVVWTTQDTGRFFQNEATSWLYDIEFLQGTARQIGGIGNGGAVWANRDIHFENCRFTENESLSRGGAAVISTNGSIMPIDTNDAVFVNCTFDSNSTGLAGGAMWVRLCNLRLENCCFTGNTSADTAPNIQNDNGVITLTGINKFDSAPHIVNGPGGSVSLAAGFEVPLGTEFVIE